MAVERFLKNQALILGKNITRLRKASGLSQDQLAEKLEVGTRYVQKLESGVHTPSVGLLVRLKKVLKAEWAELMSGM